MTGFSYSFYVYHIWAIDTVFLNIKRSIWVILCFWNLHDNHVYGIFLRTAFDMLYFSLCLCQRKESVISRWSKVGKWGEWFQLVMLSELLSMSIGRNSNVWMLTSKEGTRMGSPDLVWIVLVLGVLMFDTLSLKFVWSELSAFLDDSDLCCFCSSNVFVHIS